MRFLENEISRNQATAVRPTTATTTMERERKRAEDRRGGGGWSGGGGRAVSCTRRVLGCGRLGRFGRYSLDRNHCKLIYSIILNTKQQVSISLLMTS